MSCKFFSPQWNVILVQISCAWRSAATVSLHCGLILRLRNVIVGICNRQAGTRLPSTPGQAVRGVSVHSCRLLNPHGIPVVCQRSCKVSISDRTERAGRSAGRQLPVTDRTINKPDLSVQTPLRLSSKGPGTDPNSYTDQTTELRSPAVNFFFFFFFSPCSSRRSEKFMGAECNRGFFIGGVKMTVHMSLVPKLRMRGAVPPFPHTFTGDVCDETGVTVLLCPSR